MDRPRSLPLTAFVGALEARGHIAMSHKTATVAHTIGIDTGKNTLHLIGLDDQGAIVVRRSLPRGRIAARFANVPRCLIEIEAGMATHYVARELSALGHDVKQVPPAYAKPFRQGHKNDFRDAHAIAEAVQRPSTRCVPVKTDDQLDLQALHRVRTRLIGQRTAVINQIRGFLLEHGIAVRQELRQRTSGTDINIPLYIPPSSLLMPCAYARTIERRLEIFILAVHNLSLRKRDSMIAIVVLQR